MKFGIYFYLGKFISLKNNNKYTVCNLLYVILYLVFALGYYFIKNNLNLLTNEIIRFIFALFGIYIFVGLFKNINHSKVLDTFKKYTFQIYLLHTIFAAGIRIVLLKFGIKDYFIHFMFGMFFSIYMPVLISKISEKIKYTNFLFYPTKTIEELEGRNLR